MNDRSVAGNHRRIRALFRGFAQRARHVALSTGVVVATVLAASFGITHTALAASCNPGSPYPPTPCTVVVTPSVVEEGGTVTVTGAGFAPGSSVSIDILSHVIHLATATADSDGDASAQVVLPDEVEARTHVIRMTGINPDGTKRVLEGTVRVVEDDHDHGRVPPANLAHTGTPNIFGIGILATSSLSVAGLTLMWARRRRRRAHED